MKYIAIEEFCNHHGVAVTLIREFADFGLVPLHIENSQEYLPDNAIARLERTLRIFQDLDVNKEGIEVILHMRKQLRKLRREHKILLNRLQQLENQGIARNYIIQEIDLE
ncbi:MAG: chaperone modulator CbpM [Adhaeribacter sp.]